MNLEKGVVTHSRSQSFWSVQRLQGDAEKGRAKKVAGTCTLEALALARLVPRGLAPVTASGVVCAHCPAPHWPSAPSSGLAVAAVAPCRIRWPQQPECSELASQELFLCRKEQPFLPRISDWPRSER